LQHRAGSPARRRGGEIAAWIAWLKAKGAVSIVLAGHGRGGAQAALYAKKKADKMDKAVTKLVLISPLVQTFESAEADYAARGRGVLIERATQASQLAGQGEPAAMMDKAGFLGCQQAKVTAGAFADYYSSSPRLFTPNLLPAIKQPVLVIAGDADPEYTALEAGMQGKTSPGHVFETIAGADHLFGDLFAEQLAARIGDFVLKK
jgi:pimeloyl-ACP methyl ester carboxylesterase